MKRLALIAFVLLATPAAAQTKVGSARPSAFGADSTRLYDSTGAFVGTAQPNAFDPSRTDLSNTKGEATGIQTRPNAFDPTGATMDVFDARDPDHR